MKKLDVIPVGLGVLIVIFLNWISYHGEYASLNQSIVVFLLLSLSNLVGIVLLVAFVVRRWYNHFLSLFIGGVLITSLIAIPCGGFLKFICPLIW